MTPQRTGRRCRSRSPTRNTLPLTARKAVRSLLPVSACKILASVSCFSRGANNNINPIPVCTGFILLQNQPFLMRFGFFSPLSLSLSQLLQPPHLSYYTDEKAESACESHPVWGGGAQSLLPLCELDLLATCAGASCCLSGSLASATGQSVSFLWHEMASGHSLLVSIRSSGREQHCCTLPTVLAWSGDLL